METTKKTDEKGRMSQTNFMLDDVIETCDAHWEEKDVMILKLTIQKIEYGRICIAELLAQGGETVQSMKNYYQKLDAELQDKIREVGGKPTGFIFPENFF